MNMVSSSPTRHPCHVCLPLGSRIIRRGRTSRASCYHVAACFHRVARAHPGNDCPHDGCDHNENDGDDDDDDAVDHDNDNDNDNDYDDDDCR